MSGVEPKNSGMEQLLESVQGSFRNFLDSTVGVDMGKLMLPDVYGETKPATAEERVDWSSIVCDEDGEDTGMRVQVWNGDGSVEEMTHCTDMAMVLKSLHDRKLAEGSEVTSGDIGEALRGYFSSRPLTYYMGEPVRSVMEGMIGGLSDPNATVTLDDVQIPPANYSGSADAFIRNEILHMTELAPRSDLTLLDALTYLKCKELCKTVLGDLDKSIAEDLLAEHPEVLDLPHDNTLPDRFTALIKQHYPSATDEFIETLMEIFNIRDPKATEQ